MNQNNVVKVWEESIVIPTYGIGKPEKNPIFLENRVYQGSSGVVYPHPVIEKILDEKMDKPYHAVFLENQYLKIMILPELGGRVQMAYDKVKQRHFIYYNQVIKPALVGLTGPWISGGIEFNWPQHHRPSTFDPIDFTIEEHDDGSKTIWVNEVERMFRTKGMAGFRLYPDKAYLEINAKLYNRTPFPQTFLWWANPAVKVNDHYQSIFPPDVHAVFDHGKRDVSEFPIAKGTYYKVDYSAGVDISRYKNIPVPTSYMAIKSKYDFMAGYEHDSQGGLLHVANHHVSPGKKQWTWGYGEFGQAWDRNLTDEDGPYIELMTGVFTDNQPDFSWIQPFEERTFTQYFMPYSELGAVKNATKNAAVNLEISDRDIQLKFFTTACHENAKATLNNNGVEIWSDTISVSPEEPYAISLPTGKYKTDNLHVLLRASNGSTLVDYQVEKKKTLPKPEPAKPAQAPKEIASIEQLYLTGLHIEQYRHATFRPTDYYEEALKREPGDVRNNNAMGLWLLRRGQVKQAEQYFTNAINTLEERNPNPIDGEAYFNLGTCLSMQHRFDDAFEAFYKSAWSAAWQDGAYLNLARIATRKQNYDEALQLIDQSLVKNYHSHTARHLKTIILQKLGRVDDALRQTKESIAIDHFNYGCLYEKYALNHDANPDKANAILHHFKKLIRGYAHNYIEYAFDYAHAGLYHEAMDFLLVYAQENSSVYPMIYYYLGYFSTQLGDNDNAKSYFKQASQAKSDYCFPNRVEDVAVLQTAIDVNMNDAKAHYYLGTFWYANRQYADAIACWEQSAKLDPIFPTVHRNLALAYHNKINDPAKALKSLEKAFELNTGDARILMELDQLYKIHNRPHKERLNLLERYMTLTNDRDDLYLERITLYNHLGNFSMAKKLLAERKFHPWEGGEGKVVSQYVTCHLELAKQAFEQSLYQEALSLLEQAEAYPENLGEGKLYGLQENDIWYLKGCVHETLNNKQKATDYFTKATVGLSEPVQAIYYNDQPPDKIFYQGLAWNKLGDSVKAEKIFKRLISFGKEHLHDKIKIDYFAVSLPDLLVFDQDIDLRNKLHCHYLIALGYLGLGGNSLDEASQNFDIVLRHNVNHLGAALYKGTIKSRAPA